jgi:hypothetical protein
MVVGPVELVGGEDPADVAERVSDRLRRPMLSNRKRSEYPETISARLSEAAVATASTLAMTLWMASAGQEKPVVAPPAQPERQQAARLPISGAAAYDTRHAFDGGRLVGGRTLSNLGPDAFTT